MTASNLIRDKKAQTPTLRAIHPPLSAKWDELAFAAWLKETGLRLLRAGIEVSLIPMVNADESLFLGVEVDDATARAIKRAMYN